ncbi:hypothetical protein Trydic_g6199 [Trypoxylus dichotomus]
MLMATELLTRYRQENVFLECIVSGNETWVHHFNTESKKDWMAWKHLLPPKTTINSDVYCQTVEKLHQNIRQIRRGGLAKGFRLLNDNPRPYTSNQKHNWQAIVSPPHSLDLVSSDFHLSCKRFEDDDGLQDEVR